LKQLNSIDNLQKDGKFMVAGDIPEGQGSVKELLSECFERCYKLRLSAQEAEEAAEKKQASDTTEPQKPETAA
jgi:hypothetical protein